MIVACLPLVLPVLRFQSVTKSIQLENKGESFIDDSNLGSTSSHDSVHNIITPSDQLLHAKSAANNLQQLAQTWKCLLFSTCGAINFMMSFWFVFAWEWSKGVAKLSPNTTHQLQLTEGTSTQPITVPQLSTSDTYRTLGVHISPSGSTKKAQHVLQQQALHYSSKTIASSFTQKAALMSYKLYIIPQLSYPLPAMTLTEQECSKIQSPTIMAMLPKLHFNRHTARSIVFGPLQYGGAALPHGSTLMIF